MDNVEQDYKKVLKWAKTYNSDKSKRIQKFLGHNQNGFTRNQLLFCKFLLANKSEMKRLGNMEDIFLLVRDYFKNNNDEE